MLCMQTFQSYKMYIGVIIVTPTVVCLWVYLLVLIADSFFPTVIYQKNRDSVAVQNNVQDVVWKNCSNNTKMKIEEKVKKKNFHVPKFMLELYENNRIEGANIQKPDVVRSLIPTHAGTIDNNEIFDMPSENHMLVFDLPASDSDETFIRAELKILTLLIFDNKRQKGVKRILKVSMYDDSSKNLLGFQEVSIHHLNNTWISLDLTGPVNQILKSNSKKKFLSIMVTVLAFVPSDAGGTLKLSLVPEKDTFEFDYPVLLLSYICVKEDKNEFLNHSRNNDGVRKNRVKRSIEDDYEEESNKLWDEDISPKKYSLKKLKRARNACKRKPMYVDFEEINYDSWIVQPKGYEAYQCFGRCFYPVAEHLNPTKHAIVQALLHSVTPSKVSRSCCVPTILGPISILYVDANGILTYRYAYRDMVVVECGCR